MKAYSATFYVGVGAAVTNENMAKALSTVFTDGATIVPAIGIWYGEVKPSYVVTAIANLGNIGGAQEFSEETDAQFEEMTANTAQTLGKIFGQTTVITKWERTPNAASVDLDGEDDADLDGDGDDTANDAEDDDQDEDRAELQG